MPHRVLRQPHRASRRQRAIEIEVFGGIHADGLTAVNGLSSKHGARLGADELSAPWCARSFRSIHAQRLSIAMHVAAAEEILDTVLLDGALSAMDGRADQRRLERRGVRASALCERD